MELCTVLAGKDPWVVLRRGGLNIYHWDHNRVAYLVPYLVHIFYWRWYVFIKCIMDCNWNSCILSSFLLWSQQAYPAVLIVNLISLHGLTWMEGGDDLLRKEKLCLWCITSFYVLCMFVCWHQDNVLTSKCKFCGFKTSSLRETLSCGFWIWRF